MPHDVANLLQQSAARHFSKGLPKTSVLHLPQLFHGRCRRKSDKIGDGAIVAFLFERCHF